ncbi:MAG: tRNA (adenosine(37)-N6)-threonylcarbamoyltransferase complex transferase subunit TsaD, partial [Campylobacter sp.]|nr:tRNA (adenosine(37)-N6)-threonylcarbamoyltransferase complex transferase subunit TsaD [Campylobacter sp.]
MILGIESSCDDSSVALLDSANLKLIYHKKISQE